MIRFQYKIDLKRMIELVSCDQDKESPCEINSNEGAKKPLLRNCVVYLGNTPYPLQNV